MSSKTTKTIKPESGGISIGGNVNTGGGSIAGRDVIIVSTRTENISNLFSPIYETINEIKKLSPPKRKKITQKVQTLEVEVNKKTPDKSKVGKLLTDIAKMLPDILEVVVKTINNPLIGMAVVAEKISKKAKEQN